MAKGYYGTSTEDIVDAADVGTRGALYHHFAGKKELFRAVFEEVEAEQADKALAQVGTMPAMTIIREGMVSFLDSSPGVQRVLLLDGPSVLGWEAWRALENEYGLGALRELLEQAVVDGSLPEQPVESLAHMLLAAVNEAALYVAHAADPGAAKRSAISSVDAILSGITR